MSQIYKTSFSSEWVPLLRIVSAPLVSYALFDDSESETHLLIPTTVLLQTSPSVNANPTVRMDLNLEQIWPKLVPDSCVIKQSFSGVLCPYTDNMDPLGLQEDSMGERNQK